MNNNIEQHENPEGNKTRLISINEEGVRSQLSVLVKQTVEETLNAMLDAEADELCRASKYERSPKTGKHEGRPLYKNFPCHSWSAKVKSSTFEERTV